MIRIFTILWNAANNELEELRFTLIAVVIATAIGILPILFFRPSLETCFWITLLPWVFTGYRLVSTRRFIGMYVTGEILERAHVSISNDGNQAESTNIFDNPFIRTYLSVIAGIFLAQIALFLMLPLYVNYTNGGNTTAIIIAMLAVAVAISSISFFTRMFYAAVTMTVVVYAVGLLFVLVPQVNFYVSGISEMTTIKVVPASTAKLANEIKDLQARQQEEIDNEYLKTVLAWQRDNPGKKPPAWFDTALNRGRQTGRVSPNL